MSLIVTSALVAGGIVAGRWLARLAGGHPRESAPPAPPPPPGKDEVPPPAATPAGDPFRSFPCKLGDVVMGVGSQEAWLAGALVLAEEVPALVLFIAPDAGGDRALLVRPLPGAEITWMEPVKQGSLSVGAEPPSTLELDGDHYDRLRRLPLRVTRHGTGAPDVGDQAVLAEYKSGAGTRVVVLLGAGKPHAWRGVPLDPGMYDVLGAGGD